MRQATERTTAIIGLALGALAGCSTTTEFGDEVTRYNDAAMAYNALRDDVQAMPLSTAIDMPTVGSATYEGQAVVRVDATGTALVGDARISADFSDATLTGNLNNFTGTLDGSNYGDVNGSIAIKDGEIGVASASGLTGDIKGALSNGDDQLSINGAIVGNFRSDGAINAAGLTARDTWDTDFILNGVAQDGDLGIVAIR
jgi:hypothetical protein